MAKYRKKPVVIEAFQLNKNNWDELQEWCDGQQHPVEGIFINTLEGKMTANFGDWIIKGVNGEFYPCKPDIFEKTYELVT
jgi:hypothetical protein